MLEYANFKYIVTVIKSDALKRVANVAINML